MKKPLKILVSFIKRLDILGNPPELTHQGRSNYSTLTGGLLSICVIIPATVCFIVFLLNWYSTSSPLVIEQKEYFSEYPEYNLYDMKFLYTFGLSCNNVFINAADHTKYINVQLTVETVSVSTDLQFGMKSKSFNFIPCATPGLSEYYPEFLENNLTKGFFFQYSICLNATLNDRKDLIVKGRNGDAYFNSITYKITPCISTSLIKCIPIQDTDRYIFVAGIVEYSFTPTVYSNPLKRIPTYDQYYYLSMSQTLEVNQMLESVSIFDKRYDFLSEIFRDSYISIFKTSNQYYPRSGSDSSLIEIKISSSGSMRTILRQYEMLIDTLGNMGGIFEIFTFIALMLYCCRSAFYTRFLRREIVHHDINELTKYFPKMKTKEIYSLIDCMIDRRKDGNKLLNDMNQLDLLLRVTMKPYLRTLIPLVLIKEEQKKINSSPTELFLKGIEYTSENKMSFQAAIKILNKEMENEDRPEIEKQMSSYIFKHLAENEEESEFLKIFSGEKIGFKF